MSNAIFPTLAGLGWNIIKGSEFNTSIQRSVDMSELRASFSSAPIYHYKLSFDLLRDTVTFPEVKSLFGFVGARYGAWDSFLYSDPDDNEVTAQEIAIGDGIETEFQLIRSYGVQSESVANVQAITEVTVANTPTSNYTLGAAGVLTFAAAPGVNEPITWSGTYFYRCRFETDEQDVNQFMRKMWEARRVEFRASLGVKI